MGAQKRSLEFRSNCQTAVLGREEELQLRKRFHQSAMQANLWCASSINDDVRRLVLRGALLPLIGWFSLV